MYLISHSLGRLRYALLGLWHALCADRSFRYHVYGSALLVVACTTLNVPLSRDEWLWLGLSIALIFITELQNSALERILDRLHPEHHETIGQSKDMAAGAVLIAGIFLALVLLSIVWPRFF